MAFSRAPTVDTYSADRVSLFREIALRDGGLSGKDEDYLNVLMEVVRKSQANDNRLFLQKRAGTTALISSTSTNPVRGLFYWADQDKLFYCIGRDIIVYTIATASTTTLTNAFTSSMGAVGFCEFLYDDGSVKVIGSDGTAVTGLVAIDSSNAITTSSDVDLPAHIPTPIFLDGYLFVVKSNSADIYNSILNDPFSWDAATFITTEMEADLIVNIVKLNNYILALGKETIEYFWDAAVEAPSSPLQRNDTPIKINQYLTGLAQYGNKIYYVGKDSGGQPDVFMLKDFQVKSIGTPSITRYLNTATSSINEWTGNIVSFQGHTFYLLNAGSNKTWLIDLDTEMITRVAYQQQAIFPMLQSTTVAGTAAVSLFTLKNNSSIFKFDESLYQDNGVNFTCAAVTEASDFGTMNRKTMGRLSIIADRPSSNTTILVQWSDNDYQSFNTGIPVELNQDLVSVYQMGSFRQRIFKFSYTDNYPLRIQNIEVNINKGSA